VVTAFIFFAAGSYFSMKGETTEDLPATTNSEESSPELTTDGESTSLENATDEQSAASESPEVLTGDTTVLPTTIEGGLTIRNDTSYEPDLAALMQEQLVQKLPSEGVQILIIHTHGSEAYMPDLINNYTASDTYRTQDERYNILRVGDELTACFESYGLTVIHDREIYDYPSYTGCYGRSAEAVETYLAEHPEIAVVLDVHRDAIGSGDVIYKTLAEGSGEPSSQVMLLVGTGENGLEHPNWKENLKFALYLQSAVIDKYATLMRPIALKKERYNQQLSTASILIEVGSSGNTLSEALRAVRLFADAIAPALLDLVE
jgi:stage II sporulation protein P